MPSNIAIPLPPAEWADADACLYTDPATSVLRVSTLNTVAEVERWGRTRIRSGQDGELHVYFSGRYVPGGEPWILAAVRQLLHTRWSPSAAGTIVKSFRDRERVLPLDYDPPSGNVIYAGNEILDLSGPIITSTPITADNAWLARTPYPHSPEAPRPEKVLQFLHEVLGTREMVVYFLQLAGYCMLTTNPLRMALMLRGAGRNGKSLVLNLLEQLLGAENVVALPLHRLAGDDRFAPVNLVGKLANICGDLGERAPRDVSVFKQITGGDGIYGERKGRDGFTFRTGAVPVFSANSFPGSPDSSAAYIGRWHVIEFPRQFEEDPATYARLHALAADPEEMFGLMRLAVMGAHHVVQAGGFSVPPEALASQARFAQAVDSVRSFVVSDEVQLAPGATAEIGDLYAAYKRYCDENGARPLGKIKFTTHLEGIDGLEVRRRQHAGSTVVHGCRTALLWAPDPTVTSSEFKKSPGGIEAES